MKSHRVNAADLISRALLLTLALFATSAYCQTADIVVDSVADGDDGDFSAGNLTLREAIGLANANTDADVIAFDPRLAG